MKENIRDRSKPGTWVAIPLPKGGYALGLVARRAESRRRLRRIFIYVFGPKMQSPEEFALHINQGPNKSIRFGFTMDPAILEGRWPIVGHNVPFVPEDWPVPLVKSGPIGGGPDFMRRRELYELGEDLEEKRVFAERLVDDPNDYANRGTHGYISFEEFAERMIEGKPLLRDL
jgi:Immunity protein 26